MLIDYAKIRVIAGDGGNGSVSFRRQKHVPKGGPDGGNGGRGGNVVFQVDAQLHTLQDIKYHEEYRAGNGGDGDGGKKTGKDGRDVIIRVPRGTVLRRVGDRVIQADLSGKNDSFVAARGGRGGKGNAEFATASRQAPHFAEQGGPGEEVIYEVELKFLADVGLVGLPNAGKSTLLSKVSAARPRIADYPFTTLEPHLGIVKYEGFTSFVMADIPGLIEGASEGKGLGHRFLKHVERTSVVAILIDVTEADPNEVYKTLIEELGNYSQALLKKRRVVVLTKLDLLQHRRSQLPSLIQEVETIPISSVSGMGLRHLVSRLSSLVDETR